MKHLIEAIKLRDTNLLEEEIKERYDLINKMCGTLYPQIIYDEIVKLSELKANIQNGIPIQEEMF